VPHLRDSNVTGGHDDRVQLVGLDIGSTTTRVAVADARLLHSVATGRAEFAQIDERLRTGPARTPFRGDALDEDSLLALVDSALAAAGAAPGSFFGGGALLTGLAARAPNASAVVGALRSRVGSAVVATASDPRLEAWLAFHGNAGALSRASPERFLLNLDIGGGTANLAVGRAGEVLSTGWMWIGARHVQVEPGTYRMLSCSPEARLTLKHIGLDARMGDTLSPADLGVLVDTWVGIIESALTGKSSRLVDELVPARVVLPASREEIGLAFSGGVGSLLYDVLAGRPLPTTTAYGDLGIELAQRLAASPVLMERVVVPESLGRATVYGLLRHQTQVSGATIFLPAGLPLPTGDLPILGSIGPGDGNEQLRALLELAQAARPAGCIVVRGSLDGPGTLRTFGRALGAALREAGGAVPLTVIIEQNVAKALGGYASDWGRAPLPLVVLDEVTPGDAELMRMGEPRGGFVPLSFHRMG
jgi:ethanolamine utilization protein EutA